MIRIYIKENENIEEFEINKNAKTDELYKKIFRTYKYILAF